MQLLISEASRQFELQIRCENCMRESARLISVPRIDGAPSDVEELLESGFLRSLRFSCAKCDSAIGILVAVSLCSEVLADVA
ncbi:MULTISPECIES: hypothetical protein [Rhizobium]|uniref:Uncharacterized protein n=1 Tax=Rhizobium chutanense TaxID=2035448 RepID=A0A3S0XX38_9HYPH|nr:MULTISPECIES: hypothetical protein [Rhizobium]ARM12097.1 hypothetical protein Bra5_CH01860 [Rhizobium phaseoli Brasil 5]MBX5015921.1 hypothetical protein [Rhizobium lentis]MBX5112718.1 hypothetical protein [Rhizobium lentis]RUM06784.1 hypothetical protein EFR84_11330 [Rhizobium chutanense]